MGTLIDEGTTNPDDDLDTNIDDDPGSGEQEGGDGESRTDLLARIEKMDRQLRRANRQAERLRLAGRGRYDEDPRADRRRDDDDLDDDRPTGRRRDRDRDDDRDRDGVKERRPSSTTALERKLAETARDTDRWRDRAIRSEVTSGLARAGADPDRIRKLTRMIDVRDLEFDDDDNLVGLDDQLAELRDDFPELFRGRADTTDDDQDDEDRPRRRSTRRAPAPRLAAGSRSAAVRGTPKTTAEMIAAQITGSRRGR